MYNDGIYFVSLPNCITGNVLKVMYKIINDYGLLGTSYIYLPYFGQKLAPAEVAEVSVTYGFTANLSTTSASTVSLGSQGVFYCDPIMKLNDTKSLCSLDVINLLSLLPVTI